MSKHRRYLRAGKLMMKGVPTSESKQYCAQLAKMLENGRRWKKENPEKEAYICFKYPGEICFIASISEAFQKYKLIATNPAGLELIKSLWPWDEETEPTVLMVKAVIESL